VQDHGLRPLHSGHSVVAHRPLPPARAPEAPEPERLARAVERVLSRRFSVSAAARTHKLRESVLRGCVCRAQRAPLPRSLPPPQSVTGPDAERLLQAVERVLSRRASVCAAARDLGLSESALRGHLSRAQHVRGRS
jgi:hypothetical protein